MSSEWEHATRTCVRRLAKVRRPNAQDSHAKTVLRTQICLRHRSAESFDLRRIFDSRG